MTGDYKTPAASAFNVASSPYWGVEGLYETKLDPWRLADNRQFMQNYYQLTTQYAQRGGVEYPVSRTHADAVHLRCSLVARGASTFQTPPL
jgi:hypothetical protein